MDFVTKPVVNALAKSTLRAANVTLAKRDFGTSPRRTPWDVKIVNVQQRDLGMLLQVMFNFD